MNKTVFFLLGLFFCQGLAAKHFSQQPNDSIPSLELSFKLKDGSKRISDYYVLIYCDTNAADTLFVEKGKVSYLYLNYNHNYTLRYVKPGYRDRILIVRTGIASAIHLKDMVFDYEIELVKEDEAPNTFADLPVAVVHYDKSKKKFDYSRKYHRQVRQKSKNI
jgi:hypothetical protein